MSCYGQALAERPYVKPPPQVQMAGISVVDDDIIDGSFLPFIKLITSPYQDINACRLGSAFARGRVTGPVKALKRILADWNLDIVTAALILGYEKRDIQQVENILAGQSSLRGRDICDRLAYTVAIHHGLRSLFGDANIERQWLSEPKAALGDKSPLDYFKNGAMDKLLAVKQLVEFTAGR